MLGLREARMTDFLLLVLLASLVCFGIWNAFAPGMIFGKIADIWERRFPEWVSKPLFTCPPCMASLHGTWVWYLADGGWMWWIPFVLALSGFNRIVAANLLK